ncbi:MAG: cytochrome c oxidase assembly protein [Pseudomonadota bacterium]
MKRLCLFLGLICLGGIWLGPLLTVWRESFAAHMLAHMGVVAVAAPLVAVGLADRWPHRGAGPAAVALPVGASLLELAVVWAWHAPLLRVLAETSLLAAAAEQASFLLAGLLLWGSCLGAAKSGRMAVRAAGIFGLLLTSIHMTLLGALLALSPRPLYAAGTVTCFGLVLDAGEDQALGGVLMLLVGGVIYLAGGLALLAQLLADPAPSRKAAR